MESVNSDRYRVSKTFYWMRTLALISVVMAHANYLHTDSDIINRLIASFVDCGVAVFFFAGGGYYRWRPLIMTVKHTTKLLPPWIILGTLVYVSDAVHNGFSLTRWLFWLVGKNTYLWYLTIYVIIQIVFSVFRIEKKGRLIMCILLTVVSRVMTAYFGISGYQAFLNPLNWMGFFAAGVLFRLTVRNENMRIKLVYPIISTVAIIVCAYLDTLMPTLRLDYWTYFDCFSQFAWIMVLFSFCRTLVGLHGYEIGKASLPIYLCHIPVIGFVTNQIIAGVPLTMLLSIVITCMLYFCFLIVYKIATRFNLDKLFITVTGF